MKQEDQYVLDLKLNGRMNHHRLLFTAPSVRRLLCTNEMGKTKNAKHTDCNGQREDSWIPFRRSQSRTIRLRIFELINGTLRPTAFLHS
jgi:hypothetical protein